MRLNHKKTLKSHETVPLIKALLLISLRRLLVIKAKAVAKLEGSPLTVNEKHILLLDVNGNGIGDECEGDKGQV
jgi:hypothetical protein